MIELEKNRWINPYAVAALELYHGKEETLLITMQTNQVFAVKENIDVVLNAILDATEFNLGDVIKAVNASKAAPPQPQKVEAPLPPATPSKPATKPQRRVIRQGAAYS